MQGFRLTTKAKADLKSIAIYTQKTWGREQRNRYLTKLDETFHALACELFDCQAKAEVPEIQSGKVALSWQELKAILDEVESLKQEKTRKDDKEKAPLDYTI